MPEPSPPPNETPAAPGPLPEPQASSYAVANMGSLLQRFEERAPLPRHATGFPSLDAALHGGFRCKSVYAFASRTGEGKSAMIMSIARRMAFDGRKRVLVASLEMDTEELTERLVSSMTFKDDRAIDVLRTEGKLPALLKPLRAVADQSDLGLTDSRGQTIEDTERLLQQHMRDDQPLIDLLIIDHLQHATFEEGMSITEGTTLYMKDLKRLAKQYRVAILICCQIGRSIYGNKERRPQLKDLKWSGAIEEVSDCVMLGWLPPDRNTLSEAAQREDTEYTIEIAKHRRGPRLELKFIYRPPYFEFVEPTVEWLQAQEVKRGETVVVKDDE